MKIRSLSINKRTIKTIALVVVALLSFFVVARIATSPSFHASTIATLDEKKMDVMELTGATAATSVAISMIPGDATTPLANQIADLSSYLMLVVCALFLEKFLLTTAGYITFSILVPVACLLLIIYLYKGNNLLKVLALKMIAFGIAIVMIIPISVAITNIIDDTFATEQKIAIAKESSNEIDQAAENISEEEASGFEKFIYKIKDGFSSGIANAIQKAENAFNNFVDAIAAFIVTACVIPIVVMLFFIWIIKITFGVNIKIPKPKKHHFGKEKMEEETVTELQEV